ncbi:MAG: class D sortase, partial [Acidimicrobiales bacterium]
APVVEGDGPSALDSAVGHVPASAWPGEAGTTVLAAHDVSWFSRVDRLEPGAKLRFVAPCATYTYQVVGHQVVQRGTPIQRGDAARMVLDTCYPLDALWYTSQRYLVSARLVAIRTGSPAPAPARPSPAGKVAVAVPPSLSGAAPGAPLGRLQLAGSPSATFAQSLAPLAYESSLVRLYGAALEAAEAARSDWWSTLSAGRLSLDRQGALAGAQVARYLYGLSPTLDVSGSRLLGASAQAKLLLTGGERPGSYVVGMTASMIAGRLTLTGWTLQPVAG